MLYQDKTKWNTLLDSKDSAEIAKLLGTIEAKLLRIGNDTSDENELNFMDKLFKDAEGSWKTFAGETSDFITASLDGINFLREETADGIVAYYIVNEEGYNKIAECKSTIPFSPSAPDRDRGYVVTNKELTLDMLKEMQPGVFAHGEIENSPEGLYMTNSDIGRKLIWIAKRGGIHDWAIYVHWADKGFAHALANGDKIFKSNARKVIQCTDEALSWYRS